MLSFCQGFLTEMKVQNKLGKITIFRIIQHESEYENCDYFYDFSIAAPENHLIETVL